MTRGARTATVLALLLALLAGLLAGPAAAADGDPSDDQVADQWRADRVLVVGVAGLLWSDLDPETTPQLWSLAEDSGISAVSVRAARSTTCLLDGWATLGAGNRARYPGPFEPIPPVPLPSAPVPEEQEDGAEPGDPAAEPVDTSLSFCGLEEQVAQVGLAEPERTVERVTADTATTRFGAQAGALGDAVECSTAVGRAASLAVAGPESRFTVTDRLPDDPAELAALLARCPLTLVSLDTLTDAGSSSQTETETGTRADARPWAVRQVDAAVGALREAVAGLPGETLLVLQGVSEVNDGRPQLHVGIVSGPGFEPSWLSSASTGRAPFTQLIDVAPTVLRALGVERPPSMNGQPMRVAGERPPLAEAIEVLERANTRAVVHYRSTSTFFWTLVALDGTLLAAALLLLGLRRPRAALAGRARSGLRLAALVVASVPVATYLAGVVPWERTGSPRVTLALSVAVAAVAVGVLAAAGPWRHRRLGPPAAVLVVTLVTVVGDVLAGSPLELNGLLGYDAIVAGRFTGYGNLTFGLLAVSSLLLTACAAAWWAGRVPEPSRTRWALPVLAAGVVSVALIGAPGLGRDFGGVLAAVPGFVVLGMLLARVRVTVVRLVLVLAAAVVVVGSVAVLDWTRAADERTHLGRFVGQLLDGEAWTVVSRKATANLAILTGSPLSWTLLVAAAAAVWLLRPGGLLRSGPGRRPGGLGGARLRVLRAGLTAVALSLTVGALVNDSGVALPATAATVLVPLLVWLAAGTPAAQEAGATPAGSAPGGAPEGGDPRVNVGVRGSTG
ncbi:hypothetical protein [Modestobacter roseus]|uniref:Uncharacterized protein n=1 Tax=Modestobacter roseus TaxID=1181884 RepID=A0A562INZ7_9ACTN|nr:hypothetical protein [Modestobacter roseus]MQA35076.1 hypothetical protein [Modestobacter roseus]TWH72648.1 hypothetical protein JD78_01168 [Modestobacter roseus]